VVIPNGVTSIGGDAFRNCSGLTSIVIPGSVINIGDYAFNRCNNLAAISVDTSSQYYKSVSGVLYSKDGTRLICCPGGKSGNLSIPSGVTSIPPYSVAYCSVLQSVNIPSSVTSIGDYAFYFDTSLQSITVDSANTTYKSSNGMLCSKDGTVLICCPSGKPAISSVPDGVTTIKAYALSNCSAIQGIGIPSSVTLIGDSAFYGCTNMSAAFFHGNAPVIHGSVFSGCAPDFTVRYLERNSGFSNPWHGYPAAPFSTVGISYQTHVQDVGWQDYVSDGVTSGTLGQSRRLEAIRIKLDLDGVNGNVEYRTHIQDIGWQGWVANNALSGTIGQSNILEAIQIRLTGDISNNNEVYYRVHAQDIGWMGWAKNGESAGTAGYSLRIEAIEIVLIPRDAPAPGQTANRFIEKKAAVEGLSYRTHIQDVGWQEYVSCGATSGTSGQSKRLECIQIKLNNLDGGIEYRTHVQDIGWMEWVANDAMSGTSGQSKRLEAIQIRLTGAAANDYDVYYRVHSQNLGWLDWARNGQSSGTAGLSYRLEAIQVVLVPKGMPTPGPTVRAFVQG